MRRLIRFLLIFSILNSDDIGACPLSFPYNLKNSHEEIDPFLVDIQHFE
nr:MAG TPA: hypothetical protein [Bacteriophage sp.]